MTDIVSYTMEGRINATAPWTLVHQGDLPWLDAEWNGPEMVRNVNGLQINSTYDSGDESLTFTEVRYHGHSDAYLDYKFTFQTRIPTSNQLQWYVRLSCLLSFGLITFAQLCSCFLCFFLQGPDRASGHDFAARAQCQPHSVSISEPDGDAYSRTDCTCNTSPTAL